MKYYKLRGFEEKKKPYYLTVSVGWKSMYEVTGFLIPDLTRTQSVNYGVVLI